MIKKTLKRILAVVAMTLITLSAFPDGPFASYDNDDEVSRKFISRRLLKSMDMPIINRGDFAFEATDLNVVDVIESTSPQRWKQIRKEMIDMAKSSKLEVLWSQKNKVLHNETILYGKYDEKKGCYTILMVLYVLQGWKFKCVYVEGELTIPQDPFDYGYIFEDFPIPIISGILLAG